MHDPMVVAFEIRRPWPQRSSYPKPTVRFQWCRRRSPFVVAFGRSWYFPAMVTVWHVEPDGHDAFEVCKSRGRWRWHVWHWRIQIRLAQKVKRFLFERCIECGRRFPWGYAPVSHSWDGPRARRFHISKVAYHHECSSLVSLRQAREGDERLIRHLFAAYRLGADMGEPEALDRLTDPRNRSLEFLDARRLTLLLGYERNDRYELVSTRDEETT